MAAESQTVDLIPVVVLLGSAVVAVPLFKRLGLGSVLGYLAPGWQSGPMASRCSTIRRRSCMWRNWAW